MVIKLSKEAGVLKQDLFSLWHTSSQTDNEKCKSSLGKLRKYWQNVAMAVKQ